MKALILALISLSMLTACTTFKTSATHKLETASVEAEEFCKANKAIIVVAIDVQGVPMPYVCPTVEVGGKTERIVQPGRLRSGLVKSKKTKLGHITKYKKPVGPDPCYRYKIGGSWHIVCWPPEDGE